MGLLNKLLGNNDDPFTSTIDPAVKPTHGPRLDAPVIPLMLITQLDYDKVHGYRHHDMLMQYTYLIEERLEQDDIMVNRYDWDTSQPDTAFGYPVTSEQFYADLYDGFTDHVSKPAVTTRRSATFGNDPVLLYSPNGYTDLFIAKYFEHSDADRETAEQAINDFIDDLPGPVSNNLQYIREEIELPMRMSA